MSDEPKVVRENPHPYGEQDAYGNSISALRANLKLTPVERLRKAERQLKEAMELRDALRRAD